MKHNKHFRISLSEIGGDSTQQLRFFALLNLGIVQSLASGALRAADAVQLFYHAENCLYVQKQLRSKKANTIMSRGVQLPDLFEYLPVAEASREFYHELETIRSLCMNLLAPKRSTRVASLSVA